MNNPSCSYRNDSSLPESTGSYRFGFQGSEKDNDFNGTGNQYTTFHRSLDVRLGRWLATDPVVQPFQSTYTSMDNNPILFNDPGGDKIKGSRADKQAFRQYQRHINDRLNQITQMLNDNIQPADRGSLLSLQNDLTNQQNVAQGMARGQRGTPIYDISSTRTQNDGGNRGNQVMAADVNVDQNKTNTRRMVFNINFDQQSVDASLAGAVTIVDRYQQSEWTFFSLKGDFSDAVGSMVDMNDLQIVHRNEEGWTVNLNVQNITGQFNNANQNVTNALQNPIYSKFQQQQLNDIASGMNPQRAIQTPVYVGGVDENGRQNNGTYGQNKYQTGQPKSKSEYRNQGGHDTHPDSSPNN